MDTKTLSFTIALVGTAIALFAIVFAVFRRERSLSIFAAGFLSSVVGFMLFIGQGQLPFMLGYLLANMLLLFFQLSLAWGIRSRFKVSPEWPLRFWAYLGTWLVLLVMATTIYNSFTIRAILSSVFLMVAAVEFLLALRNSSYRMPGVIRHTSWVTVVLFLCMHATRITFLVAQTDAGTRLMDNQLVNTFTFSFSLLFAVSWGGLILLLDVSDLILQLEHRNKVLEDMATSDKLTGLKNRHSLDSRLESELERALRYNEPLSIILFDIDHFKRVNDTWGHPTGDEVLKQMASIAASRVRGPDDVYRWGGEEFLIVAPHTSLQGALALAEKLRAAIEADTFPVVGSLTASFGVAELRPAEDRDTWFKRVDLALYRAKNTGRNRVVGFGDQESLPVASVKIEWRPEWSSGNRVIDDEHRVLIELSNSLLDLALSEHGSSDLMPGMESLLEHVAEHFSDEERILAEVSYPELADHVRLHRELVSKSAELSARVSAGDATTARLFDFLVNQVVLEHLVQADSKFFEYTKKH